MPKLSDKARALIALLWQRSGGLGQALGRRGRWNLEAIEELGRCGEPAAIPYLADALFADHVDARLTAARAVEALLALTALGELPHLDESMRTGWCGAVWRKLEPRRVTKLVGQGDDLDHALLAVSSMHPNGFVREEAVRLLDLRTDGGELACLLLRLTDWVAQVRRAATEAVHRRITEEYAEEFAQALVLVARAELGSRSNQQDTLTRIYGLLTSNAARKPMLAALNGSAATSRQASFRILMRSAPDVLPEILLEALHVTDPVVRYWATRSLAGRLESEQLRTALRMLFSDPAAPIRREAFRLWTTTFVQDREGVLRRALLDESPSVRSFARFQLGEKGQAWFRQFCLEAMLVEGSSHLAAAIAGFAEAGSADDAEMLSAYLRHPLPKIRRAAVRYLLRIGGEHFIDPTFECITDTSAAVSNQARQALQPHVAGIGGPRLWQCFSSSRLPHVRRNALRLLFALPKWDALAHLLNAVLDEDPSLSALARDYICHWDARYNRTQTAPTRAQVADVRTALGLAKEKLPAATAASISFSIRCFESQ